MTNIEELMKCPDCLIEGHFNITIEKKYIVAMCENCDYLLKDRIPYPKHRSDHEAYQYAFRVGDVRPVSSHEDDEVTCSQEEWEDEKDN